MMEYYDIQDSIARKLSNKLFPSSHNISSQRYLPQFNFYNLNKLIVTGYSIQNKLTDSLSLLDMEVS